MKGYDRSALKRGKTLFFAVLFLATITLNVGVLSPPRASAAGECDAGSFPVTTSAIRDGNFAARPFPETPGGNVGKDNTTSVDYGDFISHAYNVGYDVYPSDTTPQRNQFSIQDGDFFLPGPTGLDQKVFPGDLAYNIPATNTWYYSNGNALNGAEYINWEQDVTGLLPNRQYVFVAYITNLIEDSVSNVDDPYITLKVGGTSGQVDGSTIWGPLPLSEASTNNAQPLSGWTRVAAAFNTDATGAAFLKIIDSAFSINGDDFGITAITLQVCEPVYNPLTRSFGNDVFAGGGYFDGTTCVNNGTPVTNPAVKGFGRYKPAAPTDHSTYTGTGSELGVFTPGEITGWLPGAQTVSARSAVWELSFANTIANATVKKNASLYNFGGGFGTPYCPTFPTPVAPLPRNNASLNLNTLGNGDYIVQRATVDLIAPQPIADGTRIRIFTDGDVIVRTNIRYANTGAGWGTASDIPLVEIYPTGNLLVENSVTEMTGVFKAKGNFYSCVAANGTILQANRSPEFNTPGVGHHMTYIANNCRNRLTVHGSVTAEYMYLYRSTRDGLANATVAESRNSGNLAEVFVFSPEIYLAYLSTMPTNPVTLGAPDSVVSLPPVY